jgi:SAM-dependent methyltransferase
LHSLESEQLKYELIYARHLWPLEEDPGIDHLDLFLSQIRLGEYITDFGCGSGYAALVLRAFGFTVNLVDIARNSLCKGAKKVFGNKFICAPLHRLPETLPLADWGYCTDVMEHIPEELIDVCLISMKCKVKNIFFSICGRTDYGGQMIGEELHLTVKPVDWWVEKIAKYWNTYLLNDDIEGFIIIGRE